MYGNFNTSYHISISMLHVQREGKKNKKTLDHLYSTHRDAYKALPHPPFGKSDHNSILLLTSNHLSRKHQWLDKKSGQMKQLLSYMTVLLAQTGIYSVIPPMTLRITPHQSLASSISASMTSSPQWPYAHNPTRSHGLQATFALS
jgi:hypothetical protein